MLHINRLVAASVVLALLIGCASQAPPQAVPGQQGEGEAAIDSLAVSYYEELFLELHATILEEIKERERIDDKNIQLIEAQSIVKIAEEVYLEANVILAVQLLHEAEVLLRHAP